MSPPGTDLADDYWGGRVPVAEILKFTEWHVAVWLLLAEVANNKSCNSKKMELPTLLVKASPPNSVADISPTFW